MNEHENEKIDSGREEGVQQTFSPPSDMPQADSPAPDQGPGQMPYSPVQEGSQCRGRYHGGYVRSRQPGAYSPQGQPHPQGPYQQYGSSGGWQPPERPPQTGYQWDFAQYDSAMPQGARKRRARGLVVFAVSLLCLFSVGIVGVFGYNIIWALTDTAPSAGLTDQETGEPPADSQAPPAGSGESGFSISVESRPPSGDYMPSVGERMTIPQVARAVRPSVVGVVNYQESHLFVPTTGGSGIIISEDGYIVTNAHVVEFADSLRVVFDDDTDVEAFVIGVDNRTDLAVIWVDRTGLPAAVFGDSDQLEVGETVIAIGNPGGLELAGSVTKGVVSAVNRVVATPFSSATYIQTDAAINPGNSGGPLCNEFGQVIGINTAKIVEIGYEGIGFAIPIADAIPIIEELIANGRVTGRAILGISVEVVTETAAREQGWPPGVQIRSINSDELAARGVQRGDIITHIDGERTLNLNDVIEILATKRAGDVVSLTLHRPALVGEGTTFDVDVPLIEDLR